MAIAAASEECTLASRVEAACAASPPDEGPSAVGRLLGTAAREAGAALDPVLALVVRYRRCGCFDRAAFVGAALDGSSQQRLHLHAAWRLHTADLLLFNTEYLASLHLLEAGVVLEVQTQLLQMATCEPSAFQEAVCTLVACATESSASGAAHALVADALLTDLHDWRLAQAAQHATPRLCSERFLLRMLDSVLRRSAAEDEKLLDTVLGGLGIAAVPVICGGQHGNALSRLLHLLPAALPLVEASAQQACAAALASKDATALSNVVQFMQRGLPSALYSDWFTRLADASAQTTGGLPVLLNALTVALPSDTPAALACQAQAIAGLKRLPERSAEYVSHAKRRRGHLASEHAEGGEAGAPGPSGAEGEARDIVAQYTTTGGELPAAIKAAQSNFRRKWWTDTCAPALTTPQEVPPDCDAREALIRVLEASVPPLLPRGSGDSFAARIAALREGGPQAAAMLASCDALVSAIGAGGLHTRMTAAARAVVATAATIAARADNSDGATAELLVRATLKGWLDACNACSPSTLHTSTAAWQAAFASALRAWPPLLTAALRAHLCEALRSGDGDAPATRRLSRDDAAVLLVQMAAIPIDAADAMPVAADTSSTHGDLHAWLVEALCPVRLLGPDDVMACTRGSCAYAQAASRIMQRWTLGDDGVVHVMGGGGSALSRPSMAAVVPPEWLHRLMWLHDQLRRASTPGAAHCAATLGEALSLAADWCAAAGGVPSSVTTAMDAGRWMF
jgi:hypothetical protein